MEIDIIQDIGLSRVHFMLDVELWDSFDHRIINIISPVRKWSEIKLFDDSGNKNPLLNSIPNGKGGIYLFLVKTHILPETHVYLLYVGRAHNSSSQNLRKRCFQYPTEKKRPKIRRMIEQWGKYLYIRYLPPENNAQIDAIEAELINKTLPPFNDEIPNKTISAMVKAFSI
jgi:excinuclease UvrABC nuclease subunit